MLKSHGKNKVKKIYVKLDRLHNLLDMFSLTNSQESKLTENMIVVEIGRYILASY